MNFLKGSKSKKKKKIGAMGGRGDSFSDFYTNNVKMCGIRVFCLN